MEKLVLKLICRLLKRDWSLASRNRLVGEVMVSVDALPVKDIITERDGRLYINNKPIELEQAIRLKEGARAILNNSVYKLVKEQVAFQAVTLGFHKAETERQILFGKAAIWHGQQEKVLLELLSQDTQSDA
jgi:hypothetical protein